MAAGTPTSTRLPSQCLVFRAWKNRWASEQYKGPLPTQARAHGEVARELRENPPYSVRKTPNLANSKFCKLRNLKDPRIAGPFLHVSYPDQRPIAWSAVNRDFNYLKYRLLRLPDRIGAEAGRLA